MAPKRGSSHERALRRAERERAAGLDPDDAAGRWLDQHDPPPPPPAPPKSAGKSKELHRWRERLRREREP